MGPEQALVLALVQALAQPTPARLSVKQRLAQDADPDRLFDLLGRTRMFTRLGVHLVDDPAIELPDWFAQAVLQARTLARGKGVLHYATTVQLAGALEERGIPVVPLKGAMLADTVYGDLGARASADIDLLVRPEDLIEATDAVAALGWSEPEWATPRDSLPRLHRELDHPTLPPVDLHWRVHWYESSFAQAALGRTQVAEGGGRRLQPADELAFLLLFLAREGFAGLRQTVDVAAWWASLGRPGETAAGVLDVADTHPELMPALTAAAEYSERLAGIPSGSLLAPPRRLSRAQRAALLLANPWLDGESRQQIDAEIALVDGLLSPAGGGGAFVRRQILPPDEILIGRRHELGRASPARIAVARAAHAVRLVGRCILAPRRVIARRRRS